MYIVRFLIILFVLFVLGLFQNFRPSQCYGQQTIPVQKGIQWLGSGQNPDGQWGDWSTPVVRDTVLPQTEMDYAAG